MTSLRINCAEEYLAFIKGIKKFDMIIPECFNDVYKTLINVSNVDTAKYTDNRFDECIQINSKKRAFYNKSYDITRVKEYILTVRPELTTEFDYIFDTEIQENGCCTCISFILYLSNISHSSKYIPKLLLSLENVKKYLPTWIVRFYFHYSVFELVNRDNEFIKDTFNQILEHPHSEVYLTFCEGYFDKDFKISTTRNDRFKGFYEKDVAINVSRDADGIVTPLDCHNIELFEKNNLPIFCYYLDSFTDTYEKSGDNLIVKSKSWANKEGMQGVTDLFIVLPNKKMIAPHSQSVSKWIELYQKILFSQHFDPRSLSKMDENVIRKMIERINNIINVYGINIKQATNLPITEVEKIKKEIVEKITNERKELTDIDRELINIDQKLLLKIINNDYQEIFEFILSEYKLFLNKGSLLYPQAGLFASKCRLKKDYYDSISNIINKIIKFDLKYNIYQTDVLLVGFDEILLLRLFYPLTSCDIKIIEPIIKTPKMSLRKDEVNNYSYTIIFLNGYHLKNIIMSSSINKDFSLPNSINIDDYLIKEEDINKFIEDYNDIDIGSLCYMSYKAKPEYIVNARKNFIKLLYFESNILNNPSYKDIFNNNILFSQSHMSLLNSDLSLSEKTLNDFYRLYKLKYKSHYVKYLKYARSKTPSPEQVFFYKKYLLYKTKYLKLKNKINI